MTEAENVSLETDHLEEVIEAAPPGQPVVVIQYRNRGVPWYVVFLLLAAVSAIAVAYYHRVTWRRRMYEPPPVSQKATLPVAAAPVLAASPSEPAAQAIPLALNTQPIAPGSLPVVAAPATAPQPEPVKPSPTTKAAQPESKPAAPVKPRSEVPKPAAEQPKVALEQPRPATDQPQPARDKPRKPAAPIFTIPAQPNENADPFAELYGPKNTRDTPDANPAEPSPARAAGDRPAPSKEEMIRDINAEAAEKRQKINELRDLKDRAGDELIAEAMTKTEDERLVFRRELNEILNSGSRRAGQEINDLCEKYGRNYDPALRDKVYRALMLTNGRMTIEAKLNLLRHYGVPEPGVLDYVANEIEHQQLNLRNGPRTPDQVRVLAARRLLRTRLAKTAHSASRGAYDPASAPVGRSPQGR